MTAQRLAEATTPAPWLGLRARVVRPGARSPLVRELDEPPLDVAAGELRSDDFAGTTIANLIDPHVTVSPLDEGR